MLKDKTTERKVRDVRLRRRIRERVEGTPERPRLHVFKSNAYVYTQVINDREGAVLLTASTLEKEFRDTDPYEHARAEYWRGRVLAERKGSGDVAAARAAGLFAVAVPNPSTTQLDLSKANLRVNSLAGVPLEEMLIAAS